MVFEMLIPALFTTISTPPKAKADASIAEEILLASVTFNSVVDTESFPNCLINSSFAPAKRSSLISFKITQAPSSANFLAMAFPMPPAEPVTIATLPERAFGLGIRDNFASSNNQYSMLNAS